MARLPARSPSVIDNGKLCVSRRGTTVIDFIGGKPSQPHWQSLDSSPAWRDTWKVVGNRRLRYSANSWTSSIARWNERLCLQIAYCLTSQIATLHLGIGIVIKHLNDSFTLGLYSLCSYHLISLILIIKLHTTSLVTGLKDHFIITYFYPISPRHIPSSHRHTACPRFEISHTHIMTAIDTHW